MKGLTVSFVQINCRECAQIAGNGFAKFKLFAPGWGCRGGGNASMLVASYFTVKSTDFFYSVCVMEC